MYNPYLAGFKMQENLFLAGWRLNQQLMRSYFAFWEGPDNSVESAKNNRLADWRRHILPYPYGASFSDHYGNRASDVDVEKI